MTNRIMAGLAAVLICAGSTFAQAPDEPPPPAPSLPPTWSRLTSFLPARGDAAGQGQFWATADYQFTWLRGANLPALVTTSDAGTARAQAGVLGTPGGSTLYGGWVDDQHRSGIRFNLGYWFNPEKTLGVETGFMMLESQSGIFSNNSTDGMILARPFTDANTGLPQAVLVAFPGSSNGSIDVRAHSGNFYEAHVDLTETAIDAGWYRLTSLLGYRFYRYDESVRIRQVINPTNPSFVPGTQIVTNDTFGTHNDFHGLDLGFRSQFFWNALSLDVLTKLAVGRITRTASIGGDQTITVPGAQPTFTGAGVLAGATNSGTFSYGDWKAMPEAGATLNWQIRPNLSVRLGYSFIFLNSVARAADLIDTTVNPHFFPGANAALGGPVRPAPNPMRADMWIQTINFGVQLTY
jgi:opacity protein-like surface antigen